MDQRIIYQTAAGVSVVIPAPDCGLTIEEIATKDVPEGLVYEIVTVADIPSDRTFRDAWVKVGGGVSHDMAKARDIAHDKRRKARAAEFAPLDIEATIPARAQAAEAARQVVRDKYAAIQNDIDAAADVAALKAIVDAL
jgi:hypothetical protein